MEISEKGLLVGLLYIMYQISPKRIKFCRKLSFILTAMYFRLGALLKMQNQSITTLYLSFPPKNNQFCINYASNKRSHDSIMHYISIDGFVIGILRHELVLCVETMSLVLYRFWYLESRSVKMEIPEKGLPVGLFCTCTCNVLTNVLCQPHEHHIQAVLAS